VDLARFAAAFDVPQRCPVLNEKSIRLMHARPEGSAGYDCEGRPKPVYYSCGWQNRVVGEGRFNRWHTGSIPGTAAILVRRHDGRNWVVLFNARSSPHASHLGREVDVLVHRAADAVEQWPEYDLFEETSNQTGTAVR
jgi:N-acyl-D-amino-acid deacylase